ncbi:hypothetical protein LCGC14_1233250 [marine sediment metagenome]|uniref:Uncharacterized protein n=1 Tax=marine sediment metagenome TaxID=412755 RepID=A0A0F9LC19_9ZZZZ
MKNDVNIEDVRAIEGIDNEQQLLSRAYMWQGLMKSRQTTPELYSKAMVILAEKLGFGITEEALKNASAKYIIED